MSDMISPDTLKPVIAARVRELREHAGMTQEGLAEVLGCSRLTVLRLENGETEPGATMLYSLSDLFHVPADAFRQISENSAIPA